MKGVKVVTYESLASCFEEYAGIRVEDMDTSRHYWVGHDGHRSFRIRMDKWLKTNRKCWGWVSYSNRTIHLWLSPDCSMVDLAYLLGHELGHMQRPRYPIKSDEEKKAGMYGVVTMTAVKMAEELIEKRRKG